MHKKVLDKGKPEDAMPGDKTKKVCIISLFRNMPSKLGYLTDLMNFNFQKSEG